MTKRTPAPTRRRSTGGLTVYASRGSNDVLDELTDKEHDVLRLMAEGLSDKGIAAQMHVSLNTVGTHVRQIFQKLRLSGSPANNRRVLAVLAFLQRS